MAAALVYTARPDPPPARVYCDASYLVDIFVLASPAGLKTLSATRQTQAQSARDFYIWGKGRGISFTTSILTIEEIYRKVLVTPINEVMQKRSPRPTDWKEFRRQAPADFQAALARGRHQVGRFHSFLIGLALPLIIVGRSLLASEDSAAKRITRYARVLLSQHELDGMDAFHIAVARFAGIEWVATNDRDWQTVTQIKVIGPA